MAGATIASDPRLVLKIQTHYYKFAHIHLVSYLIYTVKDDVVHLSLLDLEAELRAKYPKILIAYCNKHIYQFHFSHWEKSPDNENVSASNNADNVPDRLDMNHPELTLKQRRTVSASKLANPTRYARYYGTGQQNKEESSVDDYLPFASLSFLKAVKKLLLYNLSMQGDMCIFGNCVVGKIESTKYQRSVTQIEPILLSNGDIVVSLTQRNSLVLFHSSLLELEKKLSDFKLSFVVYIIPAGLRCHLYDTTNILASFSKSPPKGSENLLRLIKVSTGIDLSSGDQLLWVKLIPNLLHLNNQTSRISRFMHSVDNRKYITWPWKLCLLQFGSTEMDPCNIQSALCVDPMSMITEFLQFSLRSKEKKQQTPSSSNQQSSAVKIDSTSPMSALADSSSRKLNEIRSTTMNTNENAKGKYDIPSLNLYPTFTDSMSDALANNVNRHSNVEEVPEADGNEEDDLFGESSDMEKGDASSEFFISKEHRHCDKDSVVIASLTDNSKSPSLQSRVSPNRSVDQKVKNTETSLLLDFTSGLTPVQSSIIDIPRDQMISQIHEHQGPPSYEDPGAPPPLAPTPIYLLNLTNLQASSSGQTNPLKVRKVEQGCKRLSLKDQFREDTSDGNHKYMFAPIIFNPKIKSKLDTKYGKGGKFYVERDIGTEGEPTLLTSGSRRKSFLKNEEYGCSVSMHKRDSSMNQTQSTSLPEKTSGEIMKDISEYSSVVRGSAEKSLDEPHNPVLEDSDRLNEEDFEHDNHEAISEKKVESAFDEDEDDEDEDDEESDEDEEFLERNDSPLKLNVHPNHVQYILTSDSITRDGTSASQSNSVALRTQPISVSSAGHLPTKLLSEDDESPRDIIGSSVSGCISVSPFSTIGLKNMDSEDVEGASVIEIEGPEILHLSPNQNYSQTNPGAIGADRNPDEAESSNCLPLFHRSINVFSIPTNFLIRDLPKVWDPSSSTAGFAIDVEEEEYDDFQNKDGGLSVNCENIEDYLGSLTPNLTFETGSFSINEILRLNLPKNFSSRVYEKPTDGSVSRESIRAISSVFPLNYRIDLRELVQEINSDFLKDSSDASEEAKNQLSFLDGIVDGSLSESSIKNGPEKIYWDTLLPNSTLNRENFQKYRTQLDERSNPASVSLPDEDSVFILNDVKAKVMKNNKDIINLDFVGTQFWKYLDFCPVSGPKKFQIVLLSENNPHLNDGRLFEGQNLGFLEMLKDNFRNNRLGSIKKLRMPAPELRSDIDGISNGLILIDKQVGDLTYVNFYKKVNKRLKDLTELIKLDLMNKSNRFEFDRPLLLLFVSYDRSLHAVSQIAKLCRNFQSYLNNHQLSLVVNFSHIIPSDFLVKKVNDSYRLNMMSDLKLSGLSMMLYNKCPSGSFQANQADNRANGVTRSLYTQLVREPPSALHFKVFNKANREGTTTAFYDDLFLHVAYERSVDKEWLLAAWSDPQGAVTFVKSWFCQTKLSEKVTQVSHDLGTIINDLWTISGMLFSKLTEDPLQRMFGPGKKKYLVLTRISSIIPDDELVHWKRLTTKDKDISLVVISTSRLPKLLFEAKKDFKTEDSQTSDTKKEAAQFSKTDDLDRRGDKNTEDSNAEFIKSIDGVNSSPTNGLNFNSPLNHAVGSQSPNQFANTPSSFLSPMDVASTSYPSVGEPEYVVKPPFYDILAVIPKVALPSFNSPTRISMLMGYLIKETNFGSDDLMQMFMVFEVTLLSCSSFWNLRLLMRLLLNHYKRLIVLNEIIGTCDKNVTGGESPKGSSSTELRSFVPWHISAVGKALDYLSHIHVEGVDA